MKLSMIFNAVVYRNTANILAGISIAVTLLACATAEQKRANLAQQEAYQAALTRGVNAHVYEMSCQAVLPVAEELLIKRGYTTNVYDQDGLIVEMQWKDDADARRSRYIVQGMALGEQRCNLQVMAEADFGGQRSTRRSDEIELELINRIKPEIAKDIKAQAKVLSEQVYQQSLQQDAPRDTPDLREVNDEQDLNTMPERL